MKRDGWTTYPEAGETKVSLSTEARHPTRAEQDCSNCRFFDPDPDSLFGYGQCRRYPKPEMKHDESWCGEWQWVLS